MATILIHIHSGPDQPVKGTLGCIVALAAVEKGHGVTLFLAGDAVHLLAPAQADLEGLGIGRLGDLLDALKAKGATFVLSGKSSKARGYDEALLAGYDARFGTPDQLIELSVAADTVLCY